MVTNLPQSCAAIKASIAYSDVAELTDLSFRLERALPRSLKRHLLAGPNRFGRFGARNTGCHTVPTAYWVDSEHDLNVRLRSAARFLNTSDG